MTELDQALEHLEKANYFLSTNQPLTARLYVQKAMSLIDDGQRLMINRMLSERTVQTPKLKLVKQ